MKNNKPKMSRKERERRMIAEMESAMLAQKFPETDSSEKTVAQKEKPVQRKDGGQAKQAQKLHCPRCKSLMENGKCPTCGHYIYVPMSKEKRNKIRLIVGGVCVVGFVILFVLLQLKK
ncbi:MAG: hypothetical protein IJY21_05055 [Clostridia bacterium]|nr:hypothetical protein [Clostridia bacterium]